MKKATPEPLTAREFMFLEAAAFLLTFLFLKAGLYFHDAAGPYAPSTLCFAALGIVCMLVAVAPWKRQAAFFIWLLRRQK